MHSKPFRWLAAVPLLAALAVPAAQAQIQPLGSPVRVNVNTDFRQINPVAAFAPSGQALVVWENDQNGIRGRFQRLEGTAVSAELTLVANQTLAGRYEGVVRTRKDPSVAFLPSGEFLLAWTEERAYLRSSAYFENRDIQDTDIFIQRFSASGAPAGTRFRVNSTVPGLQAVPKLVVRPSGDALVVWRAMGAGVGLTSQQGIIARLVNASGQPTGAEITITGDPTADHPAVAAGRNGFLVAWDATLNNQQDVFARLYNANAHAVGNEFRVNPPTGQQRWPAVAVGADGNYLVAWQGQTTVDRSQVRIQGQFVNPAGSFLGSAFLISTDEGTGQLAPALAPTKTGFVAAWLDWSDIGLGLNAVELDATGNRVGTEFWVAETDVRKNYRTSIAANGQGGFLIPWETVASKRVVIAARSLMGQ